MFYPLHVRQSFFQGTSECKIHDHCKKITTPQGPLTMLNTNVRKTMTMEGPTICNNRYEMTMAIKECAKHQPLKMQNKKTS